MQRRTLTLLLAIIGLLLAYGFWPRAQLVDTARVARAPFLETLEEEGRTRLIDRYRISAPVPGYLQRIELEIGDPIARGQGLCRLAPLPVIEPDARSRAAAQARVAAAGAAQKAARQRAGAAEAEAEFAASELKRLQGLHGQRLVSDELLERAASQARRAHATTRSAHFEVEVAAHELEAARTTLHYSLAENSSSPSGQALDIRAPVEGVLLALYQESEGVVQAGQPLLEMGDPRSLEVVVELLSADAVRVEPGMRVVLERWGGGTSLLGEVKTIEPLGRTKLSALGVEEQRVNVIVSIRSQPQDWQRLGDGYRVEARFILWEEDGVLQIPASALFRIREQWAVYIEESGRARLREVSIGRRNGLAVQVLGGLSEGETVILHPDDAIGDGLSVRPRP